MENRIAVYRLMIRLVGKAIIVARHHASVFNERDACAHHVVLRAGCIERAHECIPWRRQLCRRRRERHCREHQAHDGEHSARGGAFLLRVVSNHGVNSVVAMTIVAARALGQSRVVRCQCCSAGHVERGQLLHDHLSLADGIGALPALGDVGVDVASQGVAVENVIAHVVERIGGSGRIDVKQIGDADRGFAAIQHL